MSPCRAHFLGQRDGSGCRGRGHAGGKDVLVVPNQTPQGGGVLEEHACSASVLAWASVQGEVWRKFLTAKHVAQIHFVGIRMGRHELEVLSQQADNLNVRQCMVRVRRGLGKGERVRR